MTELKLYSTDNVDTLKVILDEAKSVKLEPELFDSFVENCKILFFRTEDKKKENPMTLEMLIPIIKSVIGRKVNIDDVILLFEGLIDDKNEYRIKKQQEGKIKRIAGPKYTREELEVTYKEVELRDELFRINSKDLNLFNNFKLCGDQLVLEESSDCELLTEDMRGVVTIDNCHWIKPTGIAYRVKRNFMEKISIYYRKFMEFLDGLDIDNIQIDLEHGVMETPIEDFIQNELPTSFITLYKVRAVYETWTDDKGKQHKKLRNFDLKRNSKIEQFDDIFQYVLENWKKYKSMIYGQSEFLAWSNNPTDTSVSHWIPEEVKHIPEPWKEFLKEKMPEIHFQMRLITFLGMCIDADNSTQQYLIISDQGGTGKGVMMRALEHALPKNSISPIDQGVLSDNNEFGLAGLKVWNSHISVMEEYSNNSLSSDKAKKFIANNTMSLNVKGKSHVKWNPVNHKLIVFSNKKATIKEYANRRRAIPLTFIGQYKWTEEKQEALNNTAKDFLNYCYSIYKKNPLFVNNKYLVMSLEDEEQYLKDSSKFDDISDDIITKRAFNEELLRDYFNTDEYTDTEDYIDYENFYTEFIVPAEIKDGISAKEMRHKIEELLLDDKNRDYRDAFAFRYVRNGSEVTGEINTRDQNWWKWTQFLINIKNIKYKNIRRDGFVVKAYPIQFKTQEIKKDNTINDFTF